MVIGEQSHCQGKRTVLTGGSHENLWDLPCQDMKPSAMAVNSTSGTKLLCQSSYHLAGHPPLLQKAFHRRTLHNALKSLRDFTCWIISGCCCMICRKRSLSWLRGVVRFLLLRDSCLKRYVTMWSRREQQPVHTMVSERKGYWAANNLIPCQTVKLVSLAKSPLEVFSVLLPPQLLSLISMYDDRWDNKLNGE